MRKISIKNKSMRKIFAAGILSLMASTGLTSGANAAACSISGTTSFGYTGAVETCDVTQAGNYNIVVNGANGGAYTFDVLNDGGAGVMESGDIQLTSGEILTIIVGQQGVNSDYGGNGGGGSFVFSGSGTGAAPLIVGGGGGGGGRSSPGLNASSTSSGTNSNTPEVSSIGGTNGGNGENNSGYGGEGYISTLSTPTMPAQVNGYGTTTYASFGGGGNSGDLSEGGGGGGYSGGGGGVDSAGNVYGGGGGGSYVISSATSVSQTLNQDNGAGDVLFNYVGPPTSSSGSGTTGSGTTPTSVPEPSSLAILMAALVGLGGAVFYKRKNG